MNLKMKTNFGIRNSFPKRTLTRIINKMKEEKKTTTTNCSFIHSFIAIQEMLVPFFSIRIWNR